ncbi:hypothetical protein A2U01_0092793, partial [Trifolium medium]|nr:hypothetical protein [Trifolium medium]
NSSYLSCFRGSEAVKPLKVFKGSEAVKPLRVSEVLKYSL